MSLFIRLVSFSVVGGSLLVSCGQRVSSEQSINELGGIHVGNPASTMEPTSDAATKVSFVSQYGYQFKIPDSFEVENQDKGSSYAVIQGSGKQEAITIEVLNPDSGPMGKYDFDEALKQLGDSERFVPSFDFPYLVASYQVAQEGLVLQRRLILSPNNRLLLISLKGLSEQFVASVSDELDRMQFDIEAPKINGLSDWRVSQDQDVARASFELSASDNYPKTSFFLEIDIMEVVSEGSARVVPSDVIRTKAVRKENGRYGVAVLLRAEPGLYFISQMSLVDASGNSVVLSGQVGSSDFYEMKRFSEGQFRSGYEDLVPDYEDFKISEVPLIEFSITEEESSEDI